MGLWGVARANTAVGVSPVTFLLLLLLLLLHATVALSALVAPMPPYPLLSEGSGNFFSGRALLSEGKGGNFVISTMMTPIVGGPQLATKAPIPI
jgi:hypothetical protein